MNAAIMERLSLSATHRLPDCQALGQELRHSNSPRLIFYAFDLLHRNGRDSSLRTILQLCIGDPPCLGTQRCLGHCMNTGGGADAQFPF